MQIPGGKKVKNASKHFKQEGAIGRNHECQGQEHVSKPYHLGGTVLRGSLEGSSGGTESIFLTEPRGFLITTRLTVNISCYINLGL